MTVPSSANSKNCSRFDEGSRGGLRRHTAHFCYIPGKRGNRVIFFDRSTLAFGRTLRLALCGAALLGLIAAPGCDECSGFRGRCCEASDLAHFKIVAATTHGLPAANAPELWFYFLTKQSAVFSFRMGEQE